jgi:hypothetical protein
MAMKRKSDCMKGCLRTAALTVTGLPILAAMLVLAVSCRSSQTQQAGRGLSEDRELGQKFAELSRKEQALASELILARNQAPYLALDVANRKIDLKVQGHSLRSFNIVKIQRKGGSPFIAQNWLETEAKPLQSTTRPRLVPGSGEATTASVATRDPWGPKRMPADYDLICKGAQALEIRSLASEQSHNRFTRWMISSYRQFRDWTREVFRRNQTAYKESIEIWLGEDDAKLLFWSLPKQFGILVINAN